MSLEDALVKLTTTQVSFMNKTKASIKNLETKQSPRCLDLLKKKKLEDTKKVMLNEQYSAILQKNLPMKVKDPGKFTVSCIIENKDVGKVLCDFGASVNLMPLSISKKLCNWRGEAYYDRSIKYPYGRVDNVITKEGKFFFPVDFVVLNIGEDIHILLILGRPFLATR
ncbi:hypothetical protein L6164_037424 [Bauhinia variegata]|uniref:Uncharacterized protein n=1 Tax=Bauhinia variegata TaxID=167791 RepID=A0ACB9KK28_BAUVA|nr:hypothetical protein L6164_037424 [Bauhinia variegata]